MAKLLLGSVVGPQGPQGTPGVNGAQGPQGIAGPSEITATTDVVGLTSGQLLYNKSGKLGSVDIVDNLLSIDPDKPLSANQGKILKSLIDDNGSAIGQNTEAIGEIASLTTTAKSNVVSAINENTSAIGQIANDRGYITSKNVNQANINTLVSNGKFINMAGMPATGSWVVDVISLNATFVTQYASCIYDSQGLGYTGKKLMRDNSGGTWTPWKEIATTESGLIALLNGWTNNGIYRYGVSGKTTIINMRVKSGVLTQWTSIGLIPREFAPTEQVFDFAYNSNGDVIGIIIANLDGNIQIYSLSANNDIIINMFWGRS